ncbi:MAG: NlpC/P60 family protein [Candidatus Ranarchaeia archaeon]
MINLETLPEPAKKRALELIANEESRVSYENPVHCTQVAAYIAGFVNQIDFSTDKTYLNFRYRPHQLLSRVQTQNPVPGDLVVFSEEGFPKHFAIFLGDDQYFHKIGQSKGFLIASDAEIKKKYNADEVDFFSSQLNLVNS